VYIVLLARFAHSSLTSYNCNLGGANFAAGRGFFLLVLALLFYSLIHNDAVVVVGGGRGQVDELLPELFVPLRLNVLGEGFRTEIAELAAVFGQQVSEGAFRGAENYFWGFFGGIGFGCGCGEYRNVVGGNGVEWGQRGFVGVEEGRKSLPPICLPRGNEVGYVVRGNVDGGAKTAHRALGAVLN